MAASDYVHLPGRPGAGGLTVPAAPVLLMFELEERGFTLRQDGDALVVQPCNRLTREDCSLIRRWKLHILALLDYQPPEVQ